MKNIIFSYIKSILAVIITIFNNILLFYYIFQYKFFTILYSFVNFRPGTPKINAKHFEYEKAKNKLNMYSFLITRNMNSLEVNLGKCTKILPQNV